MDLSQARTNMVKSQIAPNSVVNRSLLTSMGSVDRESFLDAAYRDLAYSDYPIPLTGARRLLTPLQAARMIQALELQPGQKVLVIGAGTGYEAALLADMGGIVFAVETDPALASKGEAALAGRGVSWRSTELALGWPEESPFDCILICGAIPQVPNKPIGQLGRQGRLVAVLGNPGDGVMQVVRMVGISGGDHPERLFETTVSPLPGFESIARFEL